MWQITAFALLTESTLHHWVFKWGGLALVVLGVVDNSVIPLPGSLDVATILLSSGRHDLWWYYAFMSTAGSVIGAYFTYRLGEKGGEETLEKKIGKKRSQKVYDKFEKAGFSTLMVGSMIPPPFPITPVLIAGGVMKYPVKKYLSALAAGRAIRFTIDAILGVFFGNSIIAFFAQYYKPALYFLIGLAALGAISTVLYFKWWRKRPAAIEREKDEARQTHGNAA